MEDRELAKSRLTVSIRWLFFKLFLQLFVFAAIIASFLFCFSIFTGLIDENLMARYESEPAEGWQELESRHRWAMAKGWALPTIIVVALLLFSGRLMVSTVRSIIERCQKDG